MIEKLNTRWSAVPTGGWSAEDLAFAPPLQQNPSHEKWWRMQILN